MYELHFATTFALTYKTLIKTNKELEKRTEKALRFLKNDPFYPSLKSHKVNTRNFGEKWSSWITGDLRIIWDFDETGKQIILNQGSNVVILAVLTVFSLRFKMSPMQ